MNIKEGLAKIVGSENVIDNKQDLESYAGERCFKEHLAPWYIAKVQDADQVEELVKWANKTKTPLVPVSSKGPHIKGGSAPEVPGTVIVDMSGMNNILSINRQQRMVVVEPGVTYEQLDKALEKEGLELPLPVRPKAGKSALASVLEVDPRMNPMISWSYVDPLRCVEVIWGDGNRMYTGEAASAVRDLKKQQESQRWQVNPYGPFMFDFYRCVTGAQGTMGIVTWGALKCQVRQTIHDLYFAASDNMETVQDYVYEAMHYRFPDELFIMNNTDVAMLVGKDREDTARLIETLPKWITMVGISGREVLPEMRAAARYKDMEAVTQKCRMELTDRLPGGGVNGSKVLELINSQSEEGYWKDVYKGASQDIFFITQLDQTDKFMAKIVQIAEKTGYKTTDIGVYIQPVHIGSAYHCEFTIPYDPHSKKETAMAKATYEEASAEFSKMGAYYSRPYEIWSSTQLNKDAVSYDALRKLRDIFDPNRILNPGKLII